MLTQDQKNKLKVITTPWMEKQPTLTPSKSKWFGKHHAAVFRKLLNSHSQGLYLELGTWTGMGSTKFVTDNFPEMSLICIDTFEGSEEHQRIEAYKPIAARLWDHFCSNHWHNRRRLFPIREDSVTGMLAVEAIGLQPDVIYVDAAHDEESVYQDVSTAIECFPDAVIMGDDYVAEGQGHPGVRLGIEKAVAKGLIKKKEFKHQNRVWYLNRNVK
jgi:predicted O-methyltransferase YrrM